MGGMRPHEAQVDNLAVTFSGQATNRQGGSYRDPEAPRQAVEVLPRGQREAVEMLKLREMSLKEAAARSRMSVGALNTATAAWAGRYLPDWQSIIGTVRKEALSPGQINTGEGAHS